ncbi:hypothetical protein [Ornithinibacillus halophilus]|uniref:Amino acid transporter n=1 Tax=Ornithinibacillus halophilus TaxID=930117 RepID=A0A1M5L8E9_9BACI|nr:hypothetical protein [Ornithinibacillus halophilus]SHG61291.1 hypothetical protein SAMN05216225_104510 [Ornithinibacillus halophilus]
MSKYNEGPDKPFNDAMDHMHNIQGYPISKRGKLPLPIKIVGYFLFGGMFLMIIIALIANFIVN